MCIKRFFGNKDKIETESLLRVASPEEKSEERRDVRGTITKQPFGRLPDLLGDILSSTGLTSVQHAYHHRVRLRHI